MSLHLQPVETQPAHDLATTPETVFFVIQRQNGHWSVAAKIIAVFETELQAEMRATLLKRDHPHQHFGVAMLRSEAREVANPIQIVRMEQH